MDCPLPRPRLRPRSIDGWALRALLTYEEHCPGLLRMALCTGPLRRQTLFLTAALALLNGAAWVVARFQEAGLSNGPARDLGPIADPAAIIADVMRRRPAAVIIPALSEHAQALADVLDRLGGAPLLPPHYRDLVELLAAPDQGASAVLRHLDRITGTTFAVLPLLPPVFRQVEVVRHLDSEDEAEGFLNAVDLIRHTVPAVTDEALVASLRTLGPPDDLGDWVKRWLSKAVFAVSPPIEDDHEWTGLRCAQAMIDAAARVSKSLRDKIPEAALGRACFIAYRPGDGVVELTRLSHNQWLFHGMHERRFGSLSQDATRTLRRTLDAAGILLPASLVQSACTTKAAELLHIFDNGVWELEGLDDDEALAL